MERKIAIMKLRQHDKKTIPVATKVIQFEIDVMSLICDMGWALAVLRFAYWLFDIHFGRDRVLTCLNEE